MTLWCATTNPGKLREFRQAGAEVEPLPNLRDLRPSPEDFQTFEENAAQKALYYSQFTDGLLFADDSGLEVDVLQNEPGVRSARYAAENATDEQNNILLLEKMRNKANRRARFVCVIALAQAGKVRGLFRGEVEGEILTEPLGSGGFGYDPLFYYPPLHCGFAELPADQKFEISHRGRAFRKMLAALSSFDLGPDPVT